MLACVQNAWLFLDSKQFSPLGIEARVVSPQGDVGLAQGTSPPKPNVLRFLAIAALACCSRCVDNIRLGELRILATASSLDTLCDPALKLPPEIFTRRERRDHVASHIREPCQVHPWDFGLVSENKDRIEIQVNPVEMG